MCDCRIYYESQLAKYHSVKKAKNYIIIDDTHTTSPRGRENILLFPWRREGVRVLKK
jgi:hypothetical protein